MRVLVAVFVLALVALLWALLAIVHHVRRSRRRTRRLREMDAPVSDSLSLGLSNSRINLAPEAPELSFRDPESPATTLSMDVSEAASEPESTVSSASEDAPSSATVAIAELPQEAVFTEVRKTDAAAQGDSLHASWAEVQPEALVSAAQPEAAEAKPTGEVEQADEEGEWETSLLRTLSGGDRALIARAKMSEAWEETAMPDFVMPSRVAHAAAPVAARGHITATLFGEPFTFEALRPLQALAQEPGFPAAMPRSPKAASHATSPAAQPQGTWSPTPPRDLMQESPAAPAASLLMSPDITRSFAPPVLAVLRAPGINAAPVPTVETVAEPEPNPAEVAAADIASPVPVLARIPVAGETYAKTEIEATPEPEIIQVVAAASMVPVMARFLPAATVTAAEEPAIHKPAVAAEVELPLAAVASALPSWPLVLSRAFAAPASESPAPLEIASDELPAFVSTHAGIALPPAPLAHPVAAHEQGAPETAASAESSSQSESAEREAAEAIIAPTFPVSQPMQFQLEAAKAVPFRVSRPAPPLVRPQPPQTIPGALVALRDAGMDSSSSRITRAPRLISPLQSMPSGPAFHRVAPRLASNSSGRHLVAPLRRPDLSSYYSKDLGDLSDPIAPRGRNREPRAPQSNPGNPEEQKRQA